jgi:hypothetical protein
MRQLHAVADAGVVGMHVCALHLSSEPLGRWVPITKERGLTWPPSALPSASERDPVPDNSVESVPVITTVAEYAGQSAIRVAATQLGPRYSSSDAKRIVAEWVEFFASGPSPIQDLGLVSRTPSRLFEALAGQPQLERLSVKWGDFEDLSALSELTNLSYLRLGGASNVRDLLPLAELSALAELELESLRHAHDLGPIGAVSGVTSLAIAGAVWSLRIAHVDSISFLLEMPQLRRFRLEAVIVDDLDYSPILELPGLRSLWVMKASCMRPAFDDLVASTPRDAMTRLNLFRG